MKQIVNQRSKALTIAATGQTVEPGESVEVDDDLAAGLLEQPDNWSAAKPSRKTSGDDAGEPEEAS